MIRIIAKKIVPLKKECCSENNYVDYFLNSWVIIGLRLKQQKFLGETPRLLLSRTLINYIHNSEIYKHQNFVSRLTNRLSNYWFWSKASCVRLFKCFFLVRNISLAKKASLFKSLFFLFLVQCLCFLNYYSISQILNLSFAIWIVTI